MWGIVAEQHLPFKQPGPLPVFHSDSNLVLDQVLVHSINKTHVLVVTLELTWLLFLNMLSFNFVPTPNKSLRFTRFRKSYVYHSAVVLIKGTLLSCLMCAAQSENFPFSAAVCSQWLCICITYFCWAHLSLQFC